MINQYCEHATCLLFSITYSRCFCQHVQDFYRPPHCLRMVPHCENCFYRCFGLQIVPAYEFTGTVWSQCSFWDLHRKNRSPRYVCLLTRHAKIAHRSSCNRYDPCLQSHHGELFGRSCAANHPEPVFSATDPINKGSVSSFCTPLVPREDCSAKYHPRSK